MLMDRPDDDRARLERLFRMSPEQVESARLKDKMDALHLEHESLKASIRQNIDQWPISKAIAAVSEVLARLDLVILDIKIHNQKYNNKGNDHDD